MNARQFSIWQAGYDALLFFPDGCCSQEPHSLYMSGSRADALEVAKLLLDRPNSRMVSVQVDF